MTDTRTPLHKASDAIQGYYDLENQPPQWDVDTVRYNAVRYLAAWQEPEGRAIFHRLQESVAPVWDDPDISEQTRASLIMVLVARAIEEAREECHETE